MRFAPVSILVLLCAALFISSCSSSIIRHVSLRSKTPMMQDSLSRQLLRASVEVFSNGRQYERKAGYTRLSNDTLHLRSSILFDTLHISLDSVQQINCRESLPVGTIVAATLGGAVGGFVVGKVASSDKNADLPLGLSVIGALMGGFTAWVSDKETIYIVDPKEKSPGELAPPPKLSAPLPKPGGAKEK